MAQLDVLVMQEEQQSHKTKGNSLFSEVLIVFPGLEINLFHHKQNFASCKQIN